MISWTFGGAYSVARILVAGIEAQVKLGWYHPLGEEIPVF